MRRNALTFILMIASVVSFSQENMFTLSGGYVFANVEDTETNTSGWRINGLYEYISSGGMVSHGLSFGYIGTNATVDSIVGNQTVSNKYIINSVPIYYAPKVMFGKSESFKFFLKGALGMQFSTLKIEGTAGSGSTNDVGFYGGAGAGILKSIKDNIYLNIEYEWAYMSNSYYRDGFMNSVMGGIAFKF